MDFVRFRAVQAWCLGIHVADVIAWWDASQMIEQIDI